MSNVQPKLIAREKWLTAMESGEYEQCYGSLMRIEFTPNPEDVKVSYCAIGVANKVLDGSWDFNDNVITGLLIKKLGFKNTALNRIIEMNDEEEYSLSQIATEIRTHPSDFFK